MYGVTGLQCISQRNKNPRWLVFGMILNALNDLKIDMGTVKKILNISDDLNLSDGTKAADAVLR